MIVGNRDRCGKCKARHGGNNHSCPVHSNVSAGCCESPCNPADYVAIGKRIVGYSSLIAGFALFSRTDVDLNGLELDPPYKHQDDGSGNYKNGEIERYIKTVSK